MVIGRESPTPGTVVASDNLAYIAGLVAQVMRYGPDDEAIPTSPAFGDEGNPVQRPGRRALAFRTSNMVGIVTTTDPDLTGSGLVDL